MRVDDLDSVFALYPPRSSSAVVELGHRWSSLRPYARQGMYLAGFVERMRALVPPNRVIPSGRIRGSSARLIIVDESPGFPL